MRLLPPCGKASAAGGLSPTAFPLRFCSGDRRYAGKADRKKCFPAYCLKSRNSDRIQRPLRAKPAGNLSATAGGICPPVLLLRKRACRE